MATTIEKVYKLEVQGTDSINDLKSAIEQLNDKLKTLNETSNEYKETLEELTKLQAQLADVMNGISNSSEKTEKSISSISEKINEMGETISEVSEAFDGLGEIDDSVVDAFVDGLVDGMNEAVNSVDEIEEKLDNIDDVDVSVNVDVNEGSVENLKDTLENIEDVNVSVGVEVDDSSLDNVTTTLEGIEDVTVNVGVEVSDEALNNLSEDISTITTDFESLNDEAEKTSETINNIGGASTVKELKQEISDLRDRLVTLDKGSDDYKATVQQLIDAQVKLKEVMNAGKNETQAAEGSYNALSQRMSALKQVWKEATDEATRDEIGKQIAEINAELKGMDASIGNFQRNVGNYKSALDGLDGSFVNWKQELKECKEAMQQLDPSTQAYADAMARAAEITHQLSEQQEQIKYASTDLGDQLENVRGIATNMAAGFGAVNAAMGLFGQENEEVQQAMLKVQQAMALVQGLQGLDGFIKRTKGLSQAMGLATKATKAQTVATKADAAATKQDAAAKGAEATATAGVIPAQLGLNAAMKANPIGFIIGLVASLIAIFSLLKDKIMELIGGNKEMSAAFDKVKAVLAGFGNVIKKSVINPVKMAIIPIKTLAKVMIDLFNRDWSKIGDDFKAGMEEMKDTALDTINVVGQFKEGYDKKTAEQDEARRKQEAADREKDLDNQIKDNEAKYGNDWKYTEDAKKLYDELFKVRMAQYSQDADEYREAQRDKMAYDREFQEKQDEAAQKAADEAKKKREAAAKKAEELRKKQLNDFKSSFEKYMPNWDKYAIDINNMFEKWENGVTAFTAELATSFAKAGDSIDESLTKAYATVSAIYIEWQKTIWNDMYGKEWNANLERLFYNLDKTTQAYLKKRNQLFQEDKIKFGIEFPTDELSNFYAIYNMTKKNIEKEQEELEKTLNKFYTGALKDANILQGLLNKESDVLGEHLVENIQYYIGVYNTAIEAAASGNTELSAAYTKAFEDNMTEIINADWNKEALEKALGEYLSEFQKMLDKRNQLSMEYSTNDLEYFTKSADIYEKVYEQKMKKYTDEVELMQKQREALFEQDFNNAMRWQGVYDNAIRDLYQQGEYAEESYNLQIGYYNNLLDYYNQMSEDMTLTSEQREEAKREAAKITNDIMIAYWDEETRKIKLQKDLIKQWSNAFKDAFSGIGDILSSISDYYTGLMELEQAKIDKQLEDKEITEDQAKALYEQQRDNFEKSKNLQIAMTWINGFSAAIGAYQSMASIPYVGPVLGAIAAAAALATTAVQANKIKQTTMDNPYGGGSGGGSSSSTSFQLPDVMEYEPQLGRNETNMSDTDELNNDGSGRGRGETRVYVVESDISSALDKSNKRKTEVTF